MTHHKRAKSTPSSVSDEVTVILRGEVRRLRKKQRAGQLDSDDLNQLLRIGEAMRETEASRVGAVVNILGHRFRHRDVSDEVLKPLLDAVTGEGE